MDPVVRQYVEQKPVVIFSRSSECPVTHSMSELIKNYGANPMVYYLDEIHDRQHIEGVVQGPAGVGNLMMTPAIYIGQKFVGGANDVLSLQVQGRLVPMLMEAGAIFIWKTPPSEDDPSDDDPSDDDRW